MHAEQARPRWKTLLAFGIIYFVWGSTFFAIRVGVAEVPPLLLAALRFSVAGVAVSAGGRVGEGARVAGCLPGGVDDLCAGLWAALLGGEEGAVGCGGGGAGDDPGVHGG